MSRPASSVGQEANATTDPLAWRYAEMTHASVKGTALEVPDNVVRLSVGIEDVADLTADVLGALDRL